MNDIYELLAELLTDKHQDFLIENDYDLSKLEDLLYEEYEISIVNFEKLINDLLPFCIIAKSELTDIIYQGFGHNGVWLYEREVE